MISVLLRLLSVNNSLRHTFIYRFVMAKDYARDKNQRQQHCQNKPDDFMCFANFANHFDFEFRISDFGFADKENFNPQREFSNL
jgi:hypothetical protein